MVNTIAQGVHEGIALSLTTCNVGYARIIFVDYNINPKAYRF